MTDKTVVFNFLYELRESGKINMFESPRYLMDMFDISFKEAIDLFVEWTTTFDPER